MGTVNDVALSAYLRGGGVRVCGADQKDQALVCPLASIFGHKLSLTCFQDV